jgi:flagellar hook protein FlgE
VTIDLTSTTQFGSKFSVADLTQDGYASGELTGINIANDGMVMASYSNGVTRAEAQVALANFRNPQGLAPIGGNNWVETNDSGTPVMGKPGAGNMGPLRAGALEDSNVDLTAELVNMMTAQRTYQANAQTIKTQDQVMSTLVNLR